MIRPRILVILFGMILIVSSFSTKTTDFEDEDSMIVSPDRPSKTFLEKVFHKKLGFIANVPKKLPTWPLDKIPFYGHDLALTGENQEKTEIKEELYQAPTKEHL